ncbi:MAG TPA: hypothetical protein VLB50_09365 [Ignavibacteriaceae bacterium]|nr:hypothetical protein [Ignavibacteriaceae bacterium]
MKKVLFSILFAGLLLGGCSDINNSFPPAQNGNSGKLFKMPAAADMTTETTFSASQNISGSTGGNLQLSGSYQGASGVVTVQATLNVPSNAYPGEKVLYVANSNAFAEVDFNPSLSFDAPVLLNLTVSGLDLTGVNPSDVGFAYISDDGSYLEPISYNSLTVNTATGTLAVTNAHLSHFSRYVFTR